MSPDDRSPMPLPTSEDTQASTEAALQIGLDHGRCARIDTHMSKLFIGRTQVYKLKRAIAHPYADLTSLAARRSACEAELAINRILAPRLYESVLPVVRDAEGRIRVDGEGLVVDWIVAMRRFPDGSLLSEMAAAGTLTAALVEETADIVAAFHDGCAMSRQDGRVTDYVRVVEGLRRTVCRAVGALSSASAPLFSELLLGYERLAPLIEVRREAGFVRQGHGDLHLANICVFEGRVTPFDALEFDARLATMDVLYDWAFLLMDLGYRGRRELANVALNRYWDASGQPEGALALMPLFMATRAAVRMAVAVEREDPAEAAGYLRHAVELLAGASRPAGLVAVGGLSGTGKSTLAKLLAPELAGVCGARVLSTDRIRKDRLHSGSAAATGIADYTRAARAAIYRSLDESCWAALEAGSSVVADATFAEDRFRSDIEAVVAPRSFRGLWLRADVALRVARVERRRDDASDATGPVAAVQVEPLHLGAGWRIVPAGSSVSAVVIAAREALVVPIADPPPDSLAHLADRSCALAPPPGSGDRIT